MGDLKSLKSSSAGFSVLYVEDNKALRENASKFLKKIFDEVDTAEDGEDGLEKFKSKNYSIVISDIKMPKMDGIAFAKNIKKISPNVKIIIMSAFDDSKYLLEAIEIGVFRYLKKPVSVTNLAEILDECIKTIIDEQNAQIFYINLQNVFNYQSSMVVMIQNSKAVFANQMFLDYFDVDSIEEFSSKYKDIGSFFLKHDSFLYDTEDKKWFIEVSNNSQKLYNIKMKDKKGSYRHFILKYQDIPEKNSYGILSFDDITELNLLSLFDEKASKVDDKQKYSEELYKFLEVLKRNNAKVSIHNYYKGLSITNDGIITDLSQDVLTLKTKFLQQKAIQLEGKTLLISEALPFPIESLKIISLSFENQSVYLGGLHFVKTSPDKRKTVRIVPEDKHSISLFIGENKLHTDIRIEDISLDAVKVSAALLPPHIKEGDDVTLDIVLEMDGRPFILNVGATLFRKSVLKASFSLVFIFKEFKKTELIKYISKRQMAIIREFKGLQNG
ncbi:MAG: response regulator [Campylobacterales bacterium]|nr:response regulator [Campylobacterales bacterium]